MNVYPAGYSDEEDDDEDFDDFVFSSDYDNYAKRNQTYRKQSEEDLLYNYIRDGDLEEMKSILDGGFPIDGPLSGGWSALMVACSYGNYPAVEFLIARGANVNFCKELFSPVMALCKSGSRDEEQLIKCMDLLLDKGANINGVDRNASTCLIYACMSGYTRLVRKLVDLQCDINVQDVEGWSALFHAVNGGYEEIVHILLSAKARVDLIDRRRRSAYELATQKGYDHLGELVCSKREKRRLQEAEEITANDTEVRKKFKDPIEDLMAEFPSANAKNSSGFPSDVGKLLMSMGLGHLSKQFFAKNIHLNEFLLITDERLKEIGVRFSAHRKRILNSVRAFHLHPWNKASLGLKPRNQQMNVEDAIKVMCNVTKHLHVLDASINYVRTYQPIPIGSEIFSWCEKATHQLNLISGELGNIQYFASQLKIKEPIAPVDLIKPKKKSNRGFMNSVIFTSVLIGIVVWKKEYFISLPFVQTLCLDRN